MRYRVLVINPGSTSTKIAVFDGDKALFTKTLRHKTEELAQFDRIIDQYDFRKGLVMDSMKEYEIDPFTLEAVVGRGGLVKALPSGTYIINEQMLTDLSNSELWGRIHASSLGAFIAKAIADQLGIPSYIVDPVTVDELEDVARISGFSPIERKSLFHALNIRYCGMMTAGKLSKKYDEINLIAVHMGGGISVAVIKKGKVVDVNNAVLGMGPFSPQRAGALPIGDLLEMAFSGNYTLQEMKTMLARQGGLLSYLGTDDGRIVEQRITNGDKKAHLIYSAMCYQICKEIGACAAVLGGNIDAIFLTGGLAHDNFIVDYIKSHVSFLAEIMLFPGEMEMEALSQGAIRVLKGLEEAKKYQ
ncbi:MAG: butyrate kinase [Candidatus Cloacimonetes bacterium]|nr:butyrate kinase [Candidatus Cloacimonadota bacterium]